MADADTPEATQTDTSSPRRGRASRIIDLVVGCALDPIFMVVGDLSEWRQKRRQKRTAGEGSQ